MIGRSRQQVRNATRFLDVSQGAFKFTKVATPPIELNRLDSQSNWEYLTTISSEPT